MDADTFTGLWSELDTLREGRGLSRNALASRAGRMSGLPLSGKTLHDRMANGRRVPWDQMRAVVLALGLDERHWRARWESADSGRRRRAFEPTAPKGSVAHLPPDSGAFTGRDQEVARLRRMLTTDWPQTSVPTVLIAGMAGVGKTRLAVHTAHLLRARYDEIQLYVDLRGYGPDQPVDPASALDVLLRHLGVPAEEIPSGQDARAALYRDRLHGRRAIVLLDNAAAEGQVRPLLPASPSCCVIATSRRRLEGLDEARLMHLDVMALDAAVAVLAQLVGADRLAEEAAHAERIAVQCGRLPLALSLVGCRLRARPAWRLAHMSHRLHEEGNRLAEMGGRDRAVRAAFELSYAQLARPTREIFRLLACHPGRDFSAGSAAALAGADQTGMERVLEDLLDENLLEQHIQGRYQFHDLLRLYAHERLGEEEEPEAVAAAKRRVLAWYLRHATDADRLLVPHREPDADVEGGEVFGSHEEALAWCDAERAALDAAVRMAAQLRQPEVAWQLAHALFGYHRLRHSWTEWLGQVDVGLAAAREVADEHAEARMLNSMGVANVTMERHDVAHDCFTQALLIQRRIGDRAGQSSTLNNLGELYRLSGRHDRAVACYEQDRAICRELADVYGESISLNNLGKAQLATGHATAALASQAEALRLCGGHQDRHTRAEIHDDLGNVHRELGRPAEALRHYRQAAEEYRGVGCDVAAAGTLAAMAELLTELGRAAEARDHAKEALSILDKPGGGRCGHTGRPPA